VSEREKWRPLLRREDTPEQIARNIDAEFNAHLELRIKQLMDEGLSEEDARARAESLLGDAERAAVLCERTDRSWLLRDRVGHFLGSVAGDVGYALRIFRTSPLFACMAALCLAVGITFVTSIYSFLDGILINPLPFEEADELVMVGTHDYVSGDGRYLGSTYPDFLDWETRNHVFEHLAIFVWGAFTITDLDDPVRVASNEVSAAFTDVLAVTPVLGRGFTPDDYRSGAEPVVLISHGLWQRAWGGDPDILGRLITLNGVNRYQVVGVMPPHFTFPDYRDLWIPFRPAEPGPRSFPRHITFGRLRDGVSLDAARAEMHQIGIQVAAEHPEIEGRREVRVVRYGPFFTDPLRQPLLIIFIVACLVLLLACSNLANLMLSRATGRARELSLRAVLGAGRGRLIQQVMIESLVIALAGGVLGIVLGRLGLKLLLAHVPIELPGFMQFELNPGVLAALSGFVILSGFIFGLAPALAVRRGALGSSLRSDSLRMSSGRRHSLIRSGLVVVQISLVTVILLVTGMVMKSYHASHAAQLGSENNRLLAQYVSLGSWAYPEQESSLAFFSEAVDRLRNSPGVVDAYYATSALANMTNSMESIYSDETIRNSAQSLFWCNCWVVSPGYLTSTGVSLIAGRSFTELSEGERSKAIIVNEALARRLWADGKALGRSCYRSREPDPEHVFTVVGVIADEQFSSSGAAAGPRLYQPLVRDTSRRYGWLLVESGGEPRDLAPVLRETIRDLDPHLALTAPRTVDELLRERNWRTVVFAWILGVIGIFALLLTVVGIVGVVSYAVTSRRREFGIRLALGARAASVTRNVLGRSALRAGVGIAIGLAIALATMQFLSRILDNAEPHDPVIYAVVIAFLVTVTLLASYLPAYRIGRIDPVEVLREE